MFKVAFRNLTRQKTRYAVIFSVMVLGFAVVVLFIGTITGMNRTLQAKAARYFAGEISIAGYASGQSSLIEDQATVQTALRQSGVPFSALCRRTNYELLDAVVIFNGTQVRQRRVVGIDWNLESRSFADLEFSSGSLAGMAKGNGILVSSAVSAKTGVRAGDECMVLITTRSGSKNTLNLIVSGVYQETSFFGATAYLDIDTLNVAWGLPLGSATDMGLMLLPEVPQDWAAERIHATLAGKVKLGPIVHDRAAQSQAIASAPAERTYTIMTLDAHLSTINEITGALFTVTCFILVLFLLIVMIGINNTYRMVIRERTREIGTMRALGMPQGQLMRVFLTESGILAFMGSVSGLLLGVIGLQIMASQNFSGLALAAMFLEAGHLAWFLSPGLTALAFVVMMVAAVGGALGPARAAALLPPVQALSRGAT